MLTSCCKVEGCEQNKTEWEQTGKRWYALDIPWKEDKDGVYKENIAEGCCMF